MRVEGGVSGLPPGPFGNWRKGRVERERADVQASFIVRPVNSLPDEVRMGRTCEFMPAPWPNVTARATDRVHTSPMTDPVRLAS